MGRALLLIGGIFQVLVVVLHVVIFFGISRAPELADTIKSSFHIFNATVLAAVLFFAYISFFRRNELASTGLGRATCLFIGAFYVQRGLVEVFIRGFDPGSLGLLCMVAAVYIAVPFAPRPARRPESADAAVGCAQGRV